MSTRVRHVDFRTMQSTGKTRLRFYDVDREQLQVILDALGQARAEGDTEHDTVALAGICLSYLAAGPTTDGNANVCAMNTETGEES